VKTLISGANGFLGRHFMRYCLDRGDEVMAFDNFTGSEKGDFTGFRFEAQEFFQSTNVSFDLAIHLAAQVGGREKIEHDPLFNADSLRLDSVFFKWAVGRVKTVVYPSSSAVYGATLQAGNGFALREEMFHPSSDHWIAPDQMYGFSKLAAEYLAWTSAEHYGLNTLCIRPFSGYGEGQAETYPVPAICKRALNHENPLVVWGSGSQSRDFVHVSDVVGATMARLDGEVTGYQTMNIGSGIPVTFVEIANMAAEIVGYKPKIVVDDSKPEGVHARYCDPTEMIRWYHPAVSLYEGLSRVIESLSRAPSSK
jgi:nucleoside-diphosphate-sugar epimerase